MSMHANSISFYKLVSPEKISLARKRLYARLGMRVWLTWWWYRRLWAPRASATSLGMSACTRLCPLPASHGASSKKMWREIAITPSLSGSHTCGR